MMYDVIIVGGGVAGLHLKDMEFVQFHPKGFVKTNYLVSEAARGEGDFLINSDRDRFVEELDKRDVVSRAIMDQIENGKKVFLDLKHISKEKIEIKLPSLSLIDTIYTDTLSVDIKVH